MDGDSHAGIPTNCANSQSSPEQRSARRNNWEYGDEDIPDVRAVGKPESRTVAQRLRQTTGQAKVAALCKVLEKDLTAADIKWSLFVAAAQSYRYDSCLHPFPPHFVKNDGKDINTLRTVMACMPSMPTLLTLLEDPVAYSARRSMIDLLHWVLVEMEDPQLKMIPKSEFSKVLAHMPVGDKCCLPNYIFHLVSAPESSTELKWSNLTRGQSTIFGFHGSRLENFYSILNFGLLKTLYKKSVYGHGVYLSSELMLSLPYSPAGFAWGGSILGSEMSCVALCEVVNHPDVKYRSNSEVNDDGNQRAPVVSKCDGEMPEKYILAQNSELIRVRYLFVYAKNPHVVSKVDKGSVIGWLCRHKLLTLMVGYFIFLGSVGMSGNYNVQRYYRMLLRRWGM